MKLPVFHLELIPFIVITSVMAYLEFVIKKP